MSERGLGARGRKAIGLLAFLAGIAVYVSLAIVVADLLPDHWALDLLYFAVAGTLWVWPAARLVRWMQALDEIR